MKTPAALLLPLFLFLPLLAGCASFFTELVPGRSSEAEVVAKFGPPDAVSTLQNGFRMLDYPREPEGMENWRVVVAPDGKVVSVEQLVDEYYFARVVPGLTEEEVRELLGRPTEEKNYSRLEERVVSWRYREFGNRIMFFNAHFDPSGRVKYASRSPDPLDRRGGRR